MLLIHVCFLLFLLKISLQDCVLNNNETKSFEHELQTYLIPRGSELPCSNTSDIFVTVQFILYYYYLDDVEEIFGVNSLVYLSWYNDKLEWNPSDYGGIAETVIQNHHMWTPNVVLLNDIDLPEADHAFNSFCQVEHDGRVMCIAKFGDYSLCSTVLTDWPYDAQECRLEFGASNDIGKKISLGVSDQALSFVETNRGAEWDIIDYKQEKQDSDTQLRMVFTLKRHSAGWAAINVYPSYTLSILSITSLMLDPRKDVRLFMICFSLVNHFGFLSGLEYNIPKRSSNPPTILLYYRGSVIVTFILLLLTSILGKMCKKETSPPSWISSVNEFVLKGRWKHFVGPRWSLEQTGDKFTEEWLNFSNILNNVSLIVIVFVYICLFFSFMPHPSSLKYNIKT